MKKKCKLTSEEFPELRLLIDAFDEQSFVRIFEGEIQRLRREISNDVCQVTAPQRPKSLLFRHAAETIDDTFVFHVGGDRFLSVLNLKY
jgi:hypothetical protein